MSSGDTIIGLRTAAGLLEYHSYAPGPLGRIETHVHDTYQLCYSFNLDGSYMYRGRTWLVPAKALSVLAPHEPHAAADIADRAWRAEFLTLYPAQSDIDAALARLGRRPHDAPRTLYTPVTSHHSCGMVMRSLARACAAREATISQHAAFDALIAVLWPASQPTQPPARVARHDTRRIHTARDAMMHEPARDWTVEALARLAHLSPAHFAQLFSRIVGLPPHRFLVQQRVEIARGLLAQGASVGSAAQAAGFSDHSHLSRWFRRFVQTTPARYARQNRRNILITRLSTSED